MVLQSFVIIFLYLIVPSWFVVYLLKKKPVFKPDWATWLTYITFTFYIYFIFFWGVVSFYLRYIIPLLLLLGIFYSWHRTYSLPSLKRKGKDWIGLFILLGFTLFFGLNSLLALKGHLYQKPAIDLEFPLKDGSYYVMQGGNNSIINYHQVSDGQKFALDIVKVNKFGMRASGIYPQTLEDYAIYGASVYSPCTGEVMLLENSQPNTEIPLSEKNPPLTAAGNFVILNCQNTKVMLAHMIPGSITVQEGHIVTSGDLIGKVGNSGNSTEPHLHIHAGVGGTTDTKNLSIFDGEGIPINFNGKFLTRNDVFTN